MDMHSWIYSNNSTSLNRIGFINIALSGGYDDLNGLVRMT